MARRDGQTVIEFYNQLQPVGRHRHRHRQPWVMRTIKGADMSVDLTPNSDRPLKSPGHARR